MLVDSHCHVSPLWYEPIESLLFQMDCHGVERAVLVQMLGQFDNSYLLECVQRYPDRLRTVVAVDAAAPDALDKLEDLVGSGANGLRLRPTAASVGEDPLAIWRKAESLNIPVSCVGNPASFCSNFFAEVVKAVPNLPILLEHLGGTSAPDDSQSAVDARSATGVLAAYANVFIKVPGLGELIPRGGLLSGAESPFEEEFPSTLKNALTLFGPTRMLWGSDYPPVSTREGYGNSLTLLRKALLREVDISACDQIFGRVANKLFFRE